MKFTEILYNNFFKTNKNTIIFGAVAIIFLALSVYLIVFVLYPTIQKKLGTNDTTNVPNANRREKNIEVYFFNADWCPHCTSSKPDWKQFVNKYNNTEKNGYIINCIGNEDGVNCTDSENNPEVAELIQKYNVKHFPTVKLKKDGDIIDFDAKVSMGNLETFINTVVV